MTAASSPGAVAARGIRAVPSPCTGVCMLDADAVCMGCHRTRDEIARWLVMDDAERRRLMEAVLPGRGAVRR